MTMNAYTVNTMIQLSGAFTVTATGAPVAPTAVICRVTDPSGVVIDISASLSNPSTGVYTANYTPIITGVFQYEFMGTGAVITAGVRLFSVNQGTF